MEILISPFEHLKIPQALNHRCFPETALFASQKIKIRVLDPSRSTLMSNFHKVHT